MRILFIRHAEAVDRDEFEGPDMERPLTKAGRRKAAIGYRRLFQTMPQPDAIYTSEALRATQTADLVKAAAPKAKILQTPLLNPGKGVHGFRKIFKGLGRKPEVVAVVGHEPDFSSVISSVVAQGKLSLRLKKGACAEIEVGVGGRGVLRSLLTLDALQDE